MKILSIDTSCDDSSVAILETEGMSLLADVVHSHVDVMKEFQGVVPEIASREHLKALPLATHQALRISNLNFEDIEWISVTSGPGLMGALLVGVSYAKALSFALQKPFSVVDHIEAHLYSPCLTLCEGQSLPPFPWLTLVVSGGHTELFLVKNFHEHQWLGGTLDDAAGEAFDKIGKLLELPYPAGPRIDQLVREQAKEEDELSFSFPISKTDGFNFSFSGLKTAVLTTLKNLPKPLSEETKIKMAASAQKAIVDALIQKIELAQKKLSVEQVMVTGGVACNSSLRKKLHAYFPKPKHCTDNASMVAMHSALAFKKNILKPAPLTATAYSSFQI